MLGGRKGCLLLQIYYFLNLYYYFFKYKLLAIRPVDLKF